MKKTNLKNKAPLFVSQSNRRGLLIFLIVSLAVIFTPRILLWTSANSFFEIKSEEMAMLSSARQRNESKFLYKNRPNRRSKIYHLPHHLFDPNTFTQSDWEALGLSPKQAAVVVRFCSRGIYSNDELKRIFVIPDELYELIKDSTVYPQKVLLASEKFKTKHEVEEKLALVDVNRADEAMLDNIPGIGPFYAKNILKYRTKLGGFVRKDQLLEVWKMDPVKYSEIERFIYIDPKAIQQFNLNEVSTDELKRHPYFNWNIANSIVKMRTQKKTFHSIDELKESVLIDQALFEKIKPYITL